MQKVVSDSHTTYDEKIDPMKKIDYFVQTTSDTINKEGEKT